MLQGYVDINGLQPETSYTFKTYDSSSDINNTTYAGKTTATTKASVNFDEKYGEGIWLDIRNWDAKRKLRIHSGRLLSSGIWLEVGMTVILRWRTGIQD